MQKCLYNESIEDQLNMKVWSSALSHIFTLLKINWIICQKCSLFSSRFNKQKPANSDNKKAHWYDSYQNLIKTDEIF